MQTLSGNEKKNECIQQEAINTVIVGGGQAGLAMSRCLMQRGISSHVILEKGRLVERWRSERWDSLRLLTPNWMTRLPGDYHYAGDDPDGFMTVQETVKFFEDYASSFHAPVRTNSEVVSVERTEGNWFRVVTKEGAVWLCRNVVIATGFCDQTRVLRFSNQLPKTILQLNPADYRRPSQLPIGNVLIVGASATGCQIAHELLGYYQNELVSRRNPSSSAPEITIAVGNHTRLPRRYRGRDILYWLDAIGFFRAPCDPTLEREAPGPQIVGSTDHHDLDLGILQSLGVRLVGRAVDVETKNGGEPIVLFKNDLKESLGAADRKLSLLMDKIDEYIEQEAIDAPPPIRMPPIQAPPSPPTEIPVNDICTVIWATGYERNYPWLEKLPSLLDDKGEVRNKRGVAHLEGVYVLGMRFQMTRVSNFIDGVGADAEELADKILHCDKAPENVELGA
jgi:putative flavoprotein involved in K+ transport